MRGLQRAIFPLFLALATILAGCGQSTTLVGGEEPKLTRARTAVSLSPSSTEIAAMSVNLQLLGRTKSCNFPQPVLSVPVVMDGTKPNYEAISQSKPNLVVYDSTLFSEADLAKIKEMGIEMFDLKATSLAQYADNIRRLASRTGAETTAADYLDKVEVMRKKGLSFAQTPAPTVVVLLPASGGGDHMIAGTKGFIADVVKNSGGQMLGPDSEKFETIGAEALLALKPDVIITSGDPATVLGDARLKGMSAVQKQNVIGFKDQDILLRAGARVDKLLEVISNALRVKK